MFQSESRKNRSYFTRLSVLFQMRSWLHLLVILTFGLAQITAIPNAQANQQQMCQGMMQMMMMMQQMQAQATEQKKSEQAAYMQGQMQKDIQGLFDSRVSRKAKVAIQERLIANTPLTAEKLAELRTMSPSNRTKKLQEVSAELQVEMSKGLESSSNNAMMMMIIGMLLCQMMSKMGGGK